MVRKVPLRVVALEDWPAADRRAWSRARARGNALEEQGALGSVPEAHLPQLLRAYGSWLGYLEDREGLRSMDSGMDNLTGALIWAGS